MQAKMAFKLWLEAISPESGLVSLLVPKKVLSILETSEDLNPRCMKSPKPFEGAGKRGPSLKIPVGQPNSEMTFNAVLFQLLPSTPLAGTTTGSNLVFGAAIIPDL